MNEKKLHDEGQFASNDAVIDALQSRLDKLCNELHSAESVIDDYKREIHARQRKMAGLQQDIEVIKEAIAERSARNPNNKPKR